MNVQVKAIVARSRPHGESGAMLTLLTEKGKKEALARNVKRNSKGSVLFAQPFAYSEFQLFEGRCAIVDSADTIESFYGLRLDVEKLSLAQYLLSVAEFAAEPEEDFEGQLRLLLNCIHLLANKDVDPQIVKTVFEFKFIALEGYAPILGKCSKCKEGEAAFFDFDGGVVCGDCATGKEIPLTTSLLSALNHIINGDGAMLFSFSTDKATLTALNYISENYLSYHLGKKFPILDYYKNLRGQ